MLILDFGAVSSAPVSPAVHRSGYAAKRFTRNADLCRSVMEICALPEVIALGHTCRDLRPVALCVAQIRFESQTRRFFPARASELPTVLYRCKAVITGSVALRMLYEPKVITSAPRDLNIVVASGGGLKKLTEWLIDNDYQLDKDFLVEDSMSPCIKSFWAYITGNRIITVSESIHSDILDVVVNSPSTADMTFMTAGGLVTLYPDITLSHRTVLTNIGKRVVQNEESMGCMSCPNIIVGETNDFLHHPCGDLCPTAWRHAGTDNALLCMDWDMRYSIQQFVKRSNADWRINSVCHNPHCGNFSRAFDTSGEAFTVRPPPSLSYDVMMRKEKIKCHVPCFRKSYDGLLFATLCTEAMIVPVPVSVGVSKVKTLFNLDVDCWVRQRGDHAHNSHRLHLQRTLNELPGSVPLDFSYTLFVEDPYTFPPYNLLANAIAPPRLVETPFYGNILVIKHSRIGQGLFEIFDITDKDIIAVNAVIRSAGRFDIVPLVKKKN